MPTYQEISSNNYIIRFYRNQLRKFEEIGIGNKTEHGVTITQRIIDITRKRLDQLTMRSLLSDGYEA